MNVLVIPEDFRKDQYILKPIIEAMMKNIGSKRVRVRVCNDPLLGGVAQAMKWERIEEIIERYKGMVHLFLLCVDRDGRAGRKDALHGIENRVAQILSSPKTLLAENAWQGLEVWLLAGHKLPKAWNWSEIRDEIDPKEMYFLPFATERNLLHEPGEGRKTLAYEAAKQFARICQLCPELADLEARIKMIYAAT